ncbi:PE family protein [Mycobacterium kubicae]|uniref:PE family protein n=1 Tax=Mycobacterium kubicae TaxID=120959 RepID=UPI0007FFAF7C|nr:PE family protein [Mycobacterium kubicae]OBK52133.1 hypothetical protein A5657_17030 [Mycobacterium kubicae]
MAFVVAAPELLQGAAQDLAGIQSSLAEASAAVSAPTTGVVAAAQDEVSQAIATLFGNHGRQFQALSAQAQAFHQQFVGLVNAGANAYATAEAANVEQTLLSGLTAPAQSLFGSLTVGSNLGGEIQASVNALSSVITGAPAALSGAFQTGGQSLSQSIAGFTASLGALESGGAPGLITGFNSFANAVVAPYQALATNTINNLQAIGNTIAAHPFPFLTQLASNQAGYAQTIASSIATGIQILPAEVASLPATIQAGLQQLLAFNPAPYVQSFINNQIGYAQTIGTSLVSAAQDFGAGVQTLPAGFQAAALDLLAGNNVAAYGDINSALVNAFLPGFNGVLVAQVGQLATFDIVPIGPLGDLAPIFGIPAQMAQNFTNLLPAGSIPAQIAQNATNVLSAATNFGTTLSISDTANLTFGIPLQLVLDGIGGPANALSALNSSSVAFLSAVQTGNASAAAAALLDAPVVIADGFLNGTTVIALPPASVSLFPGATLPSTTYIPLGGLLTPLTLPQVIVDVDGTMLPLILSGNTPLGGLIPGLVSFGSQLAQAITPIG